MDILLKKSLNTALAFLLILIFAVNGTTQNDTVETVDSLAVDSVEYLDLRVGLKSSPPFVFKNEHGEWDGISIYLWEQIAARLNYNYEYVDKESLSNLINSLDSSAVDITINPLTVTSNRIEHIDFTQPFFIANSVISTRLEPKDKVMSWVSKIFSFRLLQAVLLLLFVVFLGGFIVWWFEHKTNPQFPAGWKGLWAGFWWSAATMTTVGYGDKAPQTVGGQIVGLFWMFAAILLISGFMAGIASALTVNQLDDDWKDINHLRKVQVATVAKSASSSYLTNHYIKKNDFESLTDGLQALNKGDIEAFVYDEPILRYQIERDSLTTIIRVLPFRFNTQYYSFGVPKGSPLVDQINPVLLETIEDVQWKGVLSDYDLVDF